MAGDGRVNENVGLTAVHHVFHAEHNRLVEHTKEVALATGDVAFLNQWLLVPVAAIPADTSTLVWNGERLFQAAKFGTEMQYQHLVFEEFARKVQPMVDEFLAPDGYDATIDASIVAEFAHTVYRFGHSMLLETVDRFDENFNVIGEAPGSDQQIGLIAASGVLVLAVSSGEMPWVALALACSFGFYGLVRKIVPVAPLIGFCVESLLLTPLALGYLIHTVLNGQSVAFQGDLRLDALLVLTGLSTALPLIWFAAASASCRWPASS